MNTFRWPLFSLVFLLLGCGGASSDHPPVSTNLPTRVSGKPLPEYGYQVVNSFPHDPRAFTQGLEFENGFLYESTGQKGQSSLRKVELTTGKVLHKIELDPQLFGEGMTIWKDEIVQLTYQEHLGLVYDRATFQPRRQFTYPGEGWGLTHNAEHLIMSNGTSELWFLDPKNYEIVRRLEVTANGQPVLDLNELEWVEGEVFANIWCKEIIARIDPHSGQVVGWIDLGGLRQADPAAEGNDVLNGIAYDARGKRLFVTGKHWARMYEIRLVPK